jgi:hypothetical protein
MVNDPTPVRPRRGEQPIQKAGRLLAEDRVRPLPAASVYLVAGDHGDYRVIADPFGIYCPCEARTPLCAHVLAVAMMRQQQSQPAVEEHAGEDWQMEQLWRKVGA